MLDTPPGTVRRSTAAGPGRAGGSGRDATSFKISATGAAESTTWPVGITDPSRIALRIRSSTGSRPSAAASLSIWLSYAKQACTAPNPRIAPHGGLLV